jgi:uncharacterized membrane protein YkvA (DUF1232 family)
MRSRDLQTAARNELNMDQSILNSTVKPRGATKPLWVRIILLVLVVLYAISPVDFVPDVIPLLGWIDDVVVTLSAITVALPKIIKR